MIFCVLEQKGNFYLGTIYNKRGDVSLDLSICPVCYSAVLLGMI